MTPERVNIYLFLPCEYDRSEIFYLILTTLAHNLSHNKISVTFENRLDSIIGFRVTAPEKGKLFPVPNDHLHSVDICKSSGWLAGPFCPQETILAPKTIKTSDVCPFHKKVYLTSDQQYLVHINCLENEGGIPENRLVFRVSRRGRLRVLSERILTIATNVPRVRGLGCCYATRAPQGPRLR